MVTCQSLNQSLWWRGGHYDWPTVGQSPLPGQVILEEHGQPHQGRDSSSLNKPVTVQGGGKARGIWLASRALLEIGRELLLDV